MERERNLLFGVFAVQLRKATPSQVMEAAAAWAVDPAVELPQRLIDAGAFTEHDRAAIQRFVDEAVSLHGGDIQKTLETFGEIRLGYSQLDAHVTAVTLQEPGRDTALMAPEAAPGIELPRVLEAPGRYSLKSEHARGGQGRLLLVHDEQIGRDIILKELLPGEAIKTDTPTPIRQSAGLLYRFIQEAKITGQLEHPSIVPVYELGVRPDGSPYYTMKLVKGMTLSEALRKATNLQERLAYLTNFIGVCHGVAYGHSRGIIHRDLKPNNIMVGQFGETVILDWGLAKVKGRPDIHSEEMARTMSQLQLDEDLALTRDGVVLGTPAYMAPEQARGELDDVDERSDIYSLGIILYQMITGEPPFTGRSARAVLDQVCNSTPEPVASREPEVPAALAAIVQRAIASKPRDRYQSARELAEDVQRFMSGALVKAHTYKFREISRHYYRRYKPMINLAAAAAAVLLGFAIYSYINVSNARDEAVVAWDEAEHQKYVAQIRLAQSAIENNNMKLAKETLFSTNEALRNFEWGYLLNQAHPDLFTIEGRTEATFHPDGTRLAAVSKTEPLTIYSVSDGEPLLTFDETARDIFLPTFSRDGTRLAAINMHNTQIGIWDTATGKRISAINFTDEVSGSAFALDSSGERLFVGSKDGAVLVFDVSTGREMAAYPMHARRVSILKLSENGELAVTTEPFDAMSHDVFVVREVCLWNTADGNEILRVPGIRAALSADAKLLAVSGVLDITLYDVGTHEKLWSKSNHVGLITSVEFSRGDETIVTASEDGSARIFEVNDGSTSTRFGMSVPMVQAVASPDGNYILTRDRTNGIQIWDSNSSAKVFDISPHTLSITSAEFSPDGSKIVTGSLDGTVKLWSKNGRFGTRGTPRINALLTYAVSPDTTKVAAYNYGRWTILNTDLTNESVQLGFFSGNTASIAAFNEDNTQLAISLAPSIVTIWDLATSQIVRTIQNPDAEMLGFIFDPEGKELLAGCRDNRIRVFDLQTGELAVTFEGHTGAVHALAWRPGTDEFASASADGTVRVWNRTNGKTVGVLSGHAGAVNCVSYSRSGDVLATGGEDATARSWDARTFRQLQVFRGNARAVKSVAFDSDASRLVTKTNRVASVWDAQSGDELIAIPLYERGPVSFTSRGEVLAGFMREGDPFSIRFLGAMPWATDASAQKNAISAEDRFQLYRKQALATYQEPEDLKVNTATIAVTRPALAKCIERAGRVLQERTPEQVNKPALVTGPLYNAVALLGVQEGDSLVKLADIDVTAENSPEMMSTISASIAAGGDIPDLQVLTGANQKTLHFVLIEPVELTLVRTVKRSEMEKFLGQQLEQLKIVRSNTAENSLALANTYDENTNETYALFFSTLEREQSDSSYTSFGIQDGDTIRSIHGEKVTSVSRALEQLAELLAAVKGNEVNEITLEVDRGIFQSCSIKIAIE